MLGVLGEAELNFLMSLASRTGTCDLDSVDQMPL